MKHYYQLSQLAHLTSWTINSYVFYSILSQLCSHLTVVLSHPYFSHSKSHVELYQVSYRSQYILCSHYSFSHEALSYRAGQRLFLLFISPCWFYCSFCFLHICTKELLHAPNDFFFLSSEPMSIRRVYSWSFSLRPFSLLQGTWQGMRTILIQFSLIPYIWPLQRSWLSLVLSVQSVYQDMLNLLAPITAPVSFCKEQDS